ncbi:MAG: FKBP-type peptidyl-prolyl cis-trans isomerase [Candidatus Paceibacterota bacterium]
MKEMNRNEMIAVGVAVIVVAVLLLIGILNTVVGDNRASGNNITTETNMEQTHGTGLITKDIVIGEGAEAVAGLEITTHYTGTLDDGTVFDSSVTRGAPFSFTLGVGQVIQGWDLGIAGMKVGGKRELTIPANLAYGDRAIGTIPAGSTLHFEVELLGVGGQ